MIRKGSEATEEATEEVKKTHGGIYSLHAAAIMGQWQRAWRRGTYGTYCPSLPHISTVSSALVVRPVAGAGRVLIYGSRMEISLADLAFRFWTGP
jgi:hypothetical protein